MARVVGVSRSAGHTLRKPVQESIRLVSGLGVEGDAHQGVTVKHRSRVRRDPSQPNLRQVHFMHSELLDELSDNGMPVGPGEMGENITTRDIDILALPVDTVLRIGAEAAVRVTGLRNPCSQLDSIHPGLMAATLDRDEHGELVRKAGIMAVVTRGGVVRAGDQIVADLPDAPYRRLERV